MDGWEIHDSNEDDFTSMRVIFRILSIFPSFAQEERQESGSWVPTFSDYDDMAWEIHDSNEDDLLLVWPPSPSTSLRATSRDQRRLSAGRRLGACNNYNNCNNPPITMIIQEVMTIIYDMGESEKISRHWWKCLRKNCRETLLKVPPGNVKVNLCGKRSLQNCCLGCWHVGTAHCHYHYCWHCQGFNF